jgi:hypothetical protein
MPFVFRFNFFERNIIINSSRAEPIDIPHKIIAVAIIPKNNNRIGNDARAIPVILLAYVCKKDTARYLTNPMPKDRKRMKAIVTIQMSIHSSHSINGMKITSIAVTKIKSATLSNISPKRLAVSVFLATYPSKKSLAQQKTYIKINKAVSGVINNKATAPAILPAVINEAVDILNHPKSKHNLIFHYTMHINYSIYAGDKPFGYDKGHGVERFMPFAMPKNIKLNKDGFSQVGKR